MKFSRFVKAAAWAALISPLAALAAGQPGAALPSINSHVYTQTNESDNKIIHFARRADGTLVEVQRVATGGKGNNGYKIITGEKSAPDPLVSMGPVTMSGDHKLLFSVNAGDSSVSSFAVGKDGKLQLRDHQPTGERGVPTSVTYNNTTGTLYVMHATGPNHIRSFQVQDGKLAATGKAYTVNTERFKRRFATQIITSPDDRFVLVNVLYNDFPEPVNGFPKVVSANDGTQDGVMVFPVNADGSLGKPVANDAGGKTPFGLIFLNGSNTTFVNTLSDPNGAILSTLGADGKITNSAPAFVRGATRNGASDTCCICMSPDNRYAYATNFASSDITTFEIAGDKISNAANSEGFVQGTYKSLGGVVTSGPVDSWASKDGYFYQLYPNARQLVAYRMDGPHLRKIADYPVPFNSTVGLAGF